MTWDLLLAIITEEAGAEIASRIEDRAKKELPGVRITIKKLPRVTKEIIDAVAPGRPSDAAKRLGVHPSTIYRILNKSRIVR